MVTQNQMITEVWGSIKPARPRHLITEPWVGYRLKMME
ncbi:hypothetical protein BH09SUM1_BH09SUM1_00700 [soil metagenome]